MKVKELIQKLQELPEDSEICLYSAADSMDNTTLSNINTIEFDKGFVTSDKEYYSYEYYDMTDFDGNCKETYAIIV